MHLLKGLSSDLNHTFQYCMIHMFYWLTWFTVAEAFLTMPTGTGPEVQDIRRSTAQCPCSYILFKRIQEKYIMTTKRCTTTKAYRKSQKRPLPLPMTMLWLLYVLALAAKEVNNVRRVILLLVVLLLCLHFPFIFYGNFNLSDRGVIHLPWMSTLQTVSK